MGAAESDLGSADSLRDQISSLEKKLSSLSAAHLDHTVHPSSGPILTIAGARLVCREDVTILTGPVIGLVTPTSARVLIEVSKDVPSLTMFVSLVDEDVPNGRVIATVTSQDVKGREPFVLYVNNLLPGEKYVASFSGVSRSSAGERIGSFRTIPLSPGRSLRVVAVSADDPSKVLSGEHNMWETLGERLMRSSLPPVDIMLHLGGQVCMSKTFSDCWVILQRHSIRTDLAPGEWQAIEAEVLDRMRSAYRFSWNLPTTREVLATGSHLMLPSDRDVYPNFTNDVNLSTSVGGRVATTLLRLARRVCREYQRALWDGNHIPPDSSSLVPPSSSLGSRGAKHMSLPALLASEEAFVRQVTAVYEARRRLAGRQEALVKAEKALRTVRSRPATEDGESASTAAEARVSDLKVEVAEATSAEAAAAGEAQAVDVRESSYHVLGEVGVVMLDTRWCRIAPDGAQAMDKPLVSAELIADIESRIEGSDAVRALIFCCELPLVEMSREATIDARCGGEHNLTDFHPANGSWALNDVSQKRLLDMLFAWKKRERCRQVLIVSGGVCHGLDSELSIPGTSWSIRQLTTGPLTDRTEEVRSERSGSILNNAYSYVHEPLAYQRNYAEAVVAAEHDKPSTVRAQLVGQYFARVGCLCGPIVGRVTERSAVILIEVDHEAPITCAVADVLSGAVLRNTKLLPARKPYAFVFDGLEPNRNYVIRFEGFVNADSRMGSFTTSKSYADRSEGNPQAGGGVRVTAEYSLNLVFLSGESAGSVGGGGATASVSKSSGSNASSSSGGSMSSFSSSSGGGQGSNVWGILSDVSQNPWSGVDAVVHLGGQVDMDTAVASAVALIARSEREEENSQARIQLIKEATDHLRQAYRTAWSLPGTREALAHASHIMLRGSLDFGSLLLGRSASVGSDVAFAASSISGTSKRTLRRLVEQVYREYQRQLWDPEGVADAAQFGCSSTNSGNNGEWHFHTWGPVGVFCMDVKETRLWKGRTGAMDSDTALINDQQWKCFGDALGMKAISTLVVCCEVPFVDDSIGDARYKATDPSHSYLVEHWPYHGSEILRLLNGLFEWKGAEPGRDVLLVSGGIMVGVDSLIKHEGLGIDIRQIITGPAAATPATDLWAERTGMLSDTITYEHGPVIGSHNLALLQSAGDGLGGIKTQINVMTPLDFVSNTGGGQGLKRWPIFLPQLHVDKNAGRVSGAVLAVDSGGSVEEMEEARLALNLTLLSKVLDRTDVTQGLMQTFNAMQAGDSTSFDNPVDFSRAAFKALTRYYYTVAPPALRDVAIPPNRYSLEVVARMWEEGKVGGGGGGGGAVEKVAAAGKPAGVVVKVNNNVPLALLSPSSFAKFCSEAFKNALVVRMNLLIKTKGEVFGA